MATKQTKRLARNALIPDASKMETSLVRNLLVMPKRVTHKVEMRVKTNAQRYGYFKRED